MKYSVVDIGSNTIRLIIYLVDGQKVKKIMDKKNTAGLVSYIKKDVMSEKGIKKLIKVLADFQQINELFHIDKTYYFATAGVRNTKNSKEIIGRVKEELDIKIDLLSEQKEAMLGAFAVQEDYGFEEGIILDIGGGSSEITIIDEDEITYEESLPIGSLSTYRDDVEGLFPTKKERRAIKKDVEKLLVETNFPKIDKNYQAYGVGGTIRLAGNMVAELYEPSGNKRVTKKQLKEIIRHLIDEDPKYLNALLRVNASRTHTGTTGFIILYTLMNELSVDEIHISSKGIREGYLLDKLRS